MPKRVLAFDTSGAVTSVAVCDGERVLAQDDSPAAERHAESLLPRIAACLRRAGLALHEIDLIGAGVGPGSFTGVRVGLATAKGLGIALAKPVCGVVSLDALARAGWRAHVSAAAPVWLAPVLDAFKGELFAALYQLAPEGPSCVLSPFHAGPGEVMRRLRAGLAGEPVTLLGSGLERYARELEMAAEGPVQFDHSVRVPRARDVAALSLEHAERGALPDLATLAPLYLRDSDAQLPSSALRL